MKSWILWGWLLCLSCASQPTEFLYPVAACPPDFFYLIYQKTPHHIELWEWNSHTHYAEQLLFSRFTPAGFRLLPSREGFSFIDNGMVKVKKFFKRSPRIIEFDAPIYNVELVQWIDDTLCYASGKYHNNFGIFQIDYEGEVTPLCVKESVDCMYPQKVDASLFYIERDDRLQCRIIKTEYLPPQGADFQERLSSHYNQPQQFFEVASFTTPIIFLNMVSAEEGFVVGHPALVHKTDSRITFDYYHLFQKDMIWQVERLFSFSIPSPLLFLGSDGRLYESLLPLLPRHRDTTIIYANAIESAPITLFTYDLTSHTIEQLPTSQGLFPPVEGMSGGELTDRVTMAVQEQGGVKIELVRV